MENPEDSRNLVRYGFLTKDGKKKQKELKAQHGKNFKKEWHKFCDLLPEDKAFKLADEEVGEEQYEQFVRTGFPNCRKRYRLMWETFNLSIEQVYFWIHNALTTDWAFPYIIKTKDLFTAAEHSSFFGVSQQRLGIQQDKVSQFLAVIGKMVKELFQIVRELRIIDERLAYYNNSVGLYQDGNKLFTIKGKKDKASEITLKGIWIDLVEQGAKNPASVYGMSRELQFTTLPDLFFNAPTMQGDKVDDYVARLDFNRKVKEVLARKLKTYIRWKETTLEELANRRHFTLKYLWQHYDIIRMYMSWVRPYLHNIKRMHMDLDKTNSAELLSAIEGSVIEVELVAAKLNHDQNTGKQHKKWYSVVIAHFLYRTKPVMSYQQEYQRGPMHLGRVTFTMRGYAWTKDMIENFVKYRDKQDFELLKSVSGSVEAAMKALGGDLEEYLKQAGRKVYEKAVPTGKEKSDKTEVSGNPLVHVFKGFGEIFGAFMPAKKDKAKEADKALDGEKKAALKGAETPAWQCYKNFKKAHGMLAW